MTFTELAPLKINLFLHVVGRRADGYHLLQSLFVFADIGDTINYTPTSEPLTLDITGPFASQLQADQDNLVLRAARLLNPVGTGRLQLNKQAPVAAGLGGGSADAAATLRLLNRLWQCNKSEADLRALGAALGADVPACIASRPVLTSGIGDELQELRPGLALPLLLVNPLVPTSTPAVFKAYRDLGGDFSPSLPGWPGTIPSWQDCCNDLVEAAKAVTPEINNVIELLMEKKGMQKARMSGSGASCFALFDTPSNAEYAAAALQKEQPGWWIRTAAAFAPTSPI
jgi:4-diphosphocytidyl-2-C-methyl-D-erythritol kinase